MRSRQVAEKSAFRTSGRPFNYCSQAHALILSAWAIFAPIEICDADYFRFINHSEAIRISTSNSAQLYMIGDGGWLNAYRPYWRDRPWSNGFLLPAIDFDVRQEERDVGADHCSCRYTNAP